MTAIELDLPPFATDAGCHEPLPAERLAALAALGRSAAGILGQACAAAGAMCLLSPPPQDPHA